MKYAFIGSGNMSRAIIGGMVRAGEDPKSVAVINPRNTASADEVAALYGTVTAGAEALESAEVVVLAVKPQSFPEAAAQYSPHIAKDALIISIMAGVAIRTIEDALGAARVVRVMPNLALSVGCGASGIAAGAGATGDDMETTEKMFSASGVALRVTEAQIDDVAALSGSGAAYIYYLIEALRDAAAEDGVAPETAAALAKQTLIGAARLLEAEDVPPEELRRRVTSKKGTTEAAINAMAEGGLPEAVKAGYRANKRRSAQLGSPASS